MKAENRNIKRMTAGCILFVLSFGLLFWAKKIPGAADWYSRHIYKKLVSVIGRFFGLVPFSVSEILLYIIGIVLFILLVKMVRRSIQEKSAKSAVYGFLSGLFLMASILFFIYIVNCGINYERKSFSESTGMQTETYTAAELEEVCEWVTNQVNAGSREVKRDSDGVMMPAKGVDRRAAQSMGNLGESYAQLDGYYPVSKGLLNPWVLSVQNLCGIYSPFTIEANYNSAMVPYNIPFTACHELSHLSGFMQEEEANFIAWLACSESEDADFQYSGWLTAWVYCTNVLYKVDYDSYALIRESLNPEAEADLAANREFWKNYDGAIAEASRQVNDTYLKANGQTDGVGSYDRMVDLLVAYYQEN